MPRELEAAIIINPKDWIEFNLFYPEWLTPDGCNCVYFGYDPETGDVLKASGKGGYGLICGCHKPTAPLQQILE